MTAVARILVHQWPLLIGDLLLSGPSLPGIERQFPTTGPISFNADDGISPKSLHQKIALIGDNIAIGWSGRFSVAQDVIAELVLRNESEQFNMELLNEYFDRQPASVWKEIGLVGFVNEKDRMAQFGRSYIKLRSPTFGNVGLLGTGQEAFAKFVEEYTTVPSSPGTNAPDHAIFYGLMSAGKFLTDEIRSAVSLSEFYGGGYELVTLSSNRFMKLNELTFMYWHARYKGGERVHISQLPFRTFRYAYYEDLLVIRTVDYSETDTGLTTSQTVYPIPPVHRYLTASERTNPPIPALNTKWQCHVILVQTLNDELNQALMLVNYVKDGEPWVKFIEQESYLEFAVSSVFLEQVAKQIVTNSGNQN